MKRVSSVLIFLLIGTRLLIPQEENPVKLRSEIRPLAIKMGEKGELIVICDVAPDYHISDATSELFKVFPKPITGIRMGDPQYPQGEEEEYVGFVYRGQTVIHIPITIGDDAVEGNYTILSDVTYQLCAEKTGVCYPPTTETVESELVILQGQGQIHTISGETGGISERLSRSLEQGSWMAFLLVFIGGLLTSFTPCVYPMIPITIAVIGAQATGGKFRGFVLSLFYVLGISITFSTLGFIAAKTGGLFGAYAQHPVVIVIISIIFFIMGLSMLGVFVLQMPPSLATKLQKKRRTGFIGVLLTGLVAGLIVSPCISPLLVVILTWVAKTGSVILGVGLLFSFSLGLGVLFILLGTFSGVLKNLPKSGGWMVLIERGFGVLLIALAIFFIRPVLPSNILHMLWAVFFILFGTFVGAFTPLNHESDRNSKMGKALGILAILIGGALVFKSISVWTDFGMNRSGEVLSASIGEDQWLSSDEEGYHQARLTGKPVLIDFFAEWCTACHELDEKTWPDAAVQRELQRFIQVKLDLTKNDKKTGTVQKEYKILGMPTVILLDSEGKELTRFEGYQSPGEVVKILQRY